MRRFITFLLIVGPAIAQTHQPFQTQSPASVVYGVGKDGQQTVEITNVAFEVTSTAVPGRPQDERLLLRTTTRTKHVVDEIGMDASTTVEAWPLGVDPKQKPLYALKVVDFDVPAAGEGPAPGRRFDVRVGRACAARGLDYERRSQAGANAAIVRGCQPIGDVGGDARARLEDFD